MNEARFSTELRRYWDEIARGAPAAPGELDQDLAATILSLHAMPDVPPPDAAYGNRLRENIMHATSFTSSFTSSLTIPLARPHLNGNSTPPARRALLPPIPVSLGRGAPAHLATALLALFVLIGSLIAFGPLRPAGEDRLASLPAIGTSAPTSPVEFVWETKGGPDLPLDPIGPAIAPDGNLWVPDGRNHRFQIFAPDGEFLETWGEPGSGEGQFDFQDPAISAANGQANAAFDGEGNLYVVDTANRRVQKFGPDRRFLTAWGSKGEGDGQFLTPIAVAVDGQGRVYVGDGERDVVQVFTAEGNFLAAWDADAYGGLAIAPGGNVWVTDWYENRVQQYAPDGKLLTTWDETGSGEGQFLNPSAVAVDRQGRVYLADFGNHRVQVFDADGQFLTAWGQFGSDEGEFSSPTSLVLDGLGNIYVAEESGGNRVQKFRLLPPLS